MENKQQIIVSLTTIPSRTSYLSKVITSLKNQTIKPDKILLYYQNNNLDGIDDNVIKMQDHIFNIINVYDKYKSYSKFYYTLLLNNNSIIILADDDLEYNDKFIENLINGYKIHPECIICNSYHNVITENKIIYSRDMPQTKEKLSDDMRALSGWGTLIPPNYFTYNEIKMIDNFVRDIPTHDEMWIYYAVKKLNRNFYCVKNYKSWLEIVKNQIKFPNALCDKNNTQDNVKKYGEILYRYLYN